MADRRAKSAPVIHLDRSAKIRVFSPRTASDRHTNREDFASRIRATLPRMQLSRLSVAGVLLSLALSGAPAQRTMPAGSAPSRPKALVGGLLIDGYGGPPIRNSVILIDGDKITAV
jgi:hypothetical protein